MSSLWFNVSLGKWHLQIDRWFRGGVRISCNYRVDRPWHRLIVHAAFGQHFDWKRPAQSKDPSQ